MNPLSLEEQPASGTLQSTMEVEEAVLEAVEEALEEEQTLETTTKKKPAVEGIDDGIKARFQPIILEENGSNFAAWKALIPVTLQTESYA